MDNSYDRIASFYDLFSLVLGRSYRESKSTFLEKLEEGHQVLYMGGGTGGNLPAILDKIGDSGKVFYMEASAGMIKKTKKRIAPSLRSRIVFLHQSDFEAIPLETFDAIITQYLLDILPDHDIDQLFQEINRRTDKNSRWIFVDFFEIKGRRWLINLMIQVFKFFTGNPRRDLPNYEFYFAHYGWEIQERKLMDGGFIQGWLLEKGMGTWGRRDGETKGLRDLETK